MNFEKIKSDFDTCDGDLLEIKISKVDFICWTKFVEFLKKSKINYDIHVYHIKNNSDYLKKDICLDFFDNNIYNSIIKIFINKIQINCHLISIEDIILNFDPRQVSSQEDFNSLLLFISELSESLEKNSLIYHEYLEDKPFFYYDISLNKFLEK